MSCTVASLQRPVIAVGSTGTLDDITVEGIVRTSGEYARLHAPVITRLFRRHAARMHSLAVCTPCELTERIEPGLVVRKSGDSVLVSVRGGAWIDTEMLRDLGELSERLRATCTGVVANLASDTTTYTLHAAHSKMSFEEGYAGTPPDAAAVSASPQLVMPPCLSAIVASANIPRRDIHPARIRRLVALYLRSTLAVPEFQVLQDPEASDELVRLYITNVRECDASVLYRIVADSAINATRASVSSTESGELGELTVWMRAEKAAVGDTGGPMSRLRRVARHVYRLFRS
jgi:hypothetical protein